MNSKARGRETGTSDRSQSHSARPRRQRQAQWLDALGVAPSASSEETGKASTRDKGQKAKLLEETHWTQTDPESPGSSDCTSKTSATVIPGDPGLGSPTPAQRSTQHIFRSSCPFPVPRQARGHPVDSCCSHEGCQGAVWE